MYFAALLRLFTAFTILVTVPFASASNRSCIPSYAVLPARLVHPEITFTAKAGWEITNSQRERVQVLFSELAQLTQGKLVLPQKLHVRLGPLGDDAAYLDGLLHAPVDYFSVGYRKHPKITQIVLSHEWAHALLQTNLSKRFPEIEKQLLLKGEAGSGFRSIFSAYDELFADILPVLNTRNGKATREPIFSAAKLQKGNEAARLRDFTIKHKLKGWNMEGPYAMMAPMRNFLWENYLSKPFVQQRSGPALDAIIEAVGNEVNYRLTHSTQVLSPEQINRRLMAEVTMQMEKRGL